MYERTTQMMRMKSLMREDVRSLMSVNAWIAFRASKFGFRRLGVTVSGFGFRASDFGFLVSGSEIRVSGFRFRV